MNAAQSKSKSVIAEINITPLTDIFLVLLIIVIVVAPIASQHRKDIHPPKIGGGAALSKDALVVEITKEDVFYVDNVAVPEEGLEKILAAYVPKEGEKNLVIHADKQSRGRSFLMVLDLAKKTNFERVMLSGEVQGESAQNAPAPDVKEGDGA